MNSILWLTFHDEFKRANLMAQKKDNHKQTLSLHNRKITKSYSLQSKRMVLKICQCVLICFPYVRRLAEHVASIEKRKNNQHERLGSLPPQEIKDGPQEQTRSKETRISFTVTVLCMIWGTQLRDQLPSTHD